MRRETLVTCMALLLIRREILKENVPDSQTSRIELEVIRGTAEYGYSSRVHSPENVVS